MATRNNNLPALTEEQREKLLEIAARSPKLPNGVRAKLKAFNEASDKLFSDYQAAKVIPAGRSAEEWDGETLTEDFVRAYPDREAELARLGAEVAEAMRFVKIDLDHEKRQDALRVLNVNRPDFGGAGEPSVRALRNVLGEQEDQIAEYVKAAAKGVLRIELDAVDLSGLASRATLVSANAPLPQDLYGGGIVGGAQRPVILTDFIPQVNDYDMATVDYLLETTATNTAAPVAENAAKPEATFVFTPVSVRLEAIAETLPVTDRIMRFHSALVTFIEQRLLLFVGQAEENQILNGTGVAPQLGGILTRAGLQTYARLVGENNADAIFRSHQQIRSAAFAEPSMTVINPANFTALALLKDTQGRYIYGDPHSAVIPSIWGKTLVQSTLIAAGTSLSGDTLMYTTLYRNGRVVLQFGWINDNFGKNVQTLRAEVYSALQVTRPDAFSSTTNLS